MSERWGFSCGDRVRVQRTPDAEVELAEVVRVYVGGRYEVRYDTGQRASIRAEQMTAVRSES